MLARRALSTLTCLFGVLAFATAFAVYAEDQPAPAPVAPAAPATPAVAPAPAAPVVAAPAARAFTTIEQQIEYLEGALAEGLGTQDWKMVQMAVEGYKNSKLTGKDLEVSLLRAERTAVIEHSGGGGGGGGPFGAIFGGGNVGMQVLALGLAVRAELGDATALPALRTLGQQDIPDVKPPDQALTKTQPVEYVKQDKAHTAYLRALEQKSFAILALALLKEPGISERALAELKKPEPDLGGRGGGGGMPGRRGGGGGGGGGNNATNLEQPLVLAMIASDPVAGLKSLLDFCAEDSTSFSKQAIIVSTLSRMAPGKKARESWITQFTLEADLGAQLPADVYTSLGKLYGDALKKWKPEDLNFRTGFAGMGLLTAAVDFPPKTIPADALTKLQEVRDKLPQQAGFIRGPIDTILKNQGVDPNAAVKPPTPPKDF